MNIVYTMSCAFLATLSCLLLKRAIRINYLLLVTCYSPMDVDTRRDCSLMMSACETYTSRKCVECIVPCSRRCCRHPLLLERFFDALGHLVGFWHPACRVYFPLHPARYDPVSTYLVPHIWHCLAWEHQAK